MNEQFFSQLSENEWFMVVNFLNTLDCLKLAKSCTSFRDIVYSTKYKHLLNKIQPTMNENRKWVENFMNQNDPSSFIFIQNDDEFLRLYEYISSVSFSLDESDKTFMKSFVQSVESCAMCTNKDPIFKYLMGIAIYFNWADRSSIYSSDESLKMALHWIKQFLLIVPENVIAQIDCISLQAKIDHNLHDAFVQYRTLLDKTNHPYGKASLTAIIGKCYEYGEGCDIDLKKAISCYRFASEYGIPSAKNNLALLYEYGNGVEIDLDFAASLFKAVTNRSPNPTSILNLKKISEKINPSLTQ